MRPGWLVVPLGAQPNGLTSFEHTPAGQDGLIAVATRVGAATVCRVGVDGFVGPCKA